MKYEHDTVVHTDLVRYLVDAPHFWMISGYDSQLYRAHLGEPLAQRKHKMLMQHHTKGERPTFRTECIWTNYTLRDDGTAVRRPLHRRRIRKRKLS